MIADFLTFLCHSRPPVPIRTGNLLNGNLKSHENGNDTEPY